MFARVQLSLNYIFFILFLHKTARMCKKLCTFALMKKYIFIVNPISGTHDKHHIIDLIPHYFSDEEYEIRNTEYPGHATEIASKAAQQGAYAAVAIGGDGTVNEVAQGVMHTGTALGIIPCGSGNGLARHLGISMKPELALETLRDGEVKDCDYGKINGHPFVCTAGVGFDAEVSETFSKAGKRGLPTYLKTTIGVGIKYKGEVMDLEFDDGEVIKGGRYWLVTAGNAAQYGNDFFITPDASLRDGFLDINLWKPFNKLTSPLVGFELHQRLILKNSNVRIKRCKKVTIHREKEGPIQWDGDPSWGPKDITMEIVEGGIKMVVGTPKKNRL